MSNNLSLGLTPNITIGGYTFTNVGNLIVLQCYLSANNYSACRTGVATTSYQVTAGKSYFVLGVRIISTAANTQTELGYGDTDIGLSSVAAPTTYRNALAISSIGSIGGTLEIAYAGTVSIPASKYPTVRFPLGNGSVIIYGYEA